MAGEKILNIDDSPTVQRLIEMILSSQGYQVVLASDGEEGIAKAKSERPDLILVDFVMPKMNGFQVCKTLKDDPEFSDTPIILVTSKGDKVGSKFVDTLGISEYFTKPFQPEDLLSKIREVLDKRKAAADEAAAAAAAAAATVAATSAAAAATVAAQSRAAAARPRPVETIPAAEGLEALVTEIVERAFSSFIKNTLPDLIRQEVGKTHTPGSAAPTSVGIRGDLASFRIIEVLQLLALQRQTGRLALARGDEAVDIFIKDGLIAFASSSVKGGINGMEGFLRKTCRVEEDAYRHVTRIAEMTGKPIDGVLLQERMLDAKTFGACLRRHTETITYKAMMWKDGDFFFERAQPPQFANPILLKVDDLIMEGARRSDEWVLIQQKIPSFTVVFDPMIGNAEELTRRGLSAVDLKIFSLIDGRSTVQDIIDNSGISEFDVAKSMFILLSVNLIRKKK